ncbi:hypothetical protein HMPREF3214_01410 [Alloscardovia omnicolens]|nr:hypothetical protein HMPREF3214_01410 [Alloscardovia omnicolens]
MLCVKTSLQCECVYFMSEVDTRNRYASFEASFAHQNWHNRCINRLG